MSFEKLLEPFKNEEIEWKPKSVGKSRDGQPWAMVLAYVQARAIQDRLDTVVGPQNWRVEYQHISQEVGAGADRKVVHNVMCGLSVRVTLGPVVVPTSGDDRRYSEWVTKWDGAEQTDIESFKGGISSAFKRTAVLWGIGRYLYDLDVGWAEFVPSDKARSLKAKSVKIEGQVFYWLPPKLPDWALPK